MAAQILRSSDPAPTTEATFDCVRTKLRAEGCTNGTAAAQDTVEAL